MSAFLVLYMYYSAVLLVWRDAHANTSLHFIRCGWMTVSTAVAELLLLIYILCAVNADCIAVVESKHLHLHAKLFLPPPFHSTFHYEYVYEICSDDV